ncbi:MAG: hypothetical protein HDT38_05245 [Clostridiales bacterium]|nr:hypothetical protein [Clostridiales bacterium]
MRKLKIAAAAACVCFLLTVAYAASAGSPGSANDPLVTLDYLNGTFTNQVKAMVDQTVNERQAQMEKSLNDILAGQSGSGNGSSASGGVFAVVTLTQGQTLVGNVGCEVMLRVGSAVCGSTDSVGLIDTTSGGVLGNGQALVTNHLYMVTITPRRITATSGTVRVLARGPYSIQ